MYKEMNPNVLTQESGSGPITPKIFNCSPVFSMSNWYVPDVETSNNPSNASWLIDWDYITVLNGSKILAVTVALSNSIICTA